MSVQFYDDLTDVYTFDRKRVSFSDVVKVHLIPSREDYSSFDISPNELWYTKENLREFKKDTINDNRHFGEMTTCRKRAATNTLCHKKNAIRVEEDSLVGIFDVAEFRNSFKYTHESNRPPLPCLN